MERSVSEPKGQDLLTRLGKIYARGGIGRDVFGRRTALPSEVARILEANPDRSNHCAAASPHRGQPALSPPPSQCNPDETNAIKVLQE